MSDVRPQAGEATNSPTAKTGSPADTSRNLDPLDLINIGTIHDAFGHTGVYIVTFPSGESRPAVKLPACSGMPSGSREITQLQIGDSVLCCSLPGFSYSHILGVAPQPIYDGRFVLPDSLVMRSLAGFFEDQAHYTPYENEENRLLNFSGGRPVDTLPGDWGYINELGAAVWIGKLIAQLRASDVAKIEAFCGDNLVRIFGYNLHVLTAAREHLSVNDEGEYDEIEHWTPYMWESFGAYKPGKEVIKENKGDDGGIKQGQENSRFEPKEDGQTMVFRGQTLRGYLGDGVRELITLPPHDGEEISTRDDDKKYRGVLAVEKSIDGSFAVRSAKQITLEKSLIIPVPRQLLDPDAPDGDTASGDDANYKAANYYGDGDTQEKKQFKWPDDEYPDSRNTLLWEFEAYLFGKFGLQTVDAHENDWITPDAEELKIDASKDSEIDAELFSAKLEFDASKKLPKYGEVTIDQRSGHDVRYYQSRSCIHMADDGSIIIEDGYGSQIVMTGGNIHLTCQGDVFARPGRNFIAWAPRDFIARAGWCAELTAAKKDVRIKGQNNVHVFAGDGTTGNILLECQSTSDVAKTAWDGKHGEDIESTGIILKCKDAAIDIWSDYRVFVGAEKNADGIVEVSSGAGRTIIAGDKIGNEALSRFGFMVGASRSKTSQPAQFAMDTSSAIMTVSRYDINGNVGIWAGARGGGSLELDRTIHARSSIIADGSMMCRGVMAANGMSSSSEHNGTGGGYKEPSVNSRASNVESEGAAVRQGLYEEFDNTTLDDQETGAGNSAVRDVVGFSFRDSLEHYKISEDFKLPEARWQQLYRAYGLTTTWDEPQVTAPDGVKTRPHPGDNAWEQLDHYSYVDPSAAKNVDYKKGRAKKRSEQTEEAPELTDAKLSAQYIINVQTS